MKAAQIQAINAVMRKTNCNVKQAIAFLIAEEWNVQEAIISLQAEF
jgi:hypothetical protein